MLAMFDGVKLKMESRNDIWVMDGWRNKQLQPLLLHVPSHKGG